MLTIFAFVLSFVASILAYSITSPSADSGWTDSGSQVIEYTRVNNDNLTIAVVLDNQKVTGFQIMILNPLVQVDANSLAGSITVNMPPGGWPKPGPGFRANFVRTDDVHAIYAQSGYFNIISSSSSTASTTSSGSVVVVAPTTSTSAGSTGTSDSTESDSLPTSSSAAALSYPIQTGLIGLFSLLGFALA